MMPPGALTQRLKLFVGAQHLVYALGTGHAQILAGARHARGHRAGSALLAGALRFRAMLSCVSGDHTPNIAMRLTRLLTHFATSA